MKRVSKKFYVLYCMIIICSASLIFLAINSNKSGELNGGEGPNRDSKINSPHISDRFGQNSYSGSGNQLNTSLIYEKTQYFQNQPIEDGGISITNEMSGWNMTDFQLNFTDISAKSTQIDFQTTVDDGEPIPHNMIAGDLSFANSFQIPNDCYIDNISMFLQFTRPQNIHSSHGFNITVYNAKVDGNLLVPDKPLNNFGDETYIDLGTSTSDVVSWFTASFTNTELEISNTVNNTFFAVINIANWNPVNPYGSGLYFYAYDKINDPYDTMLLKKETAASSYTELEGKKGTLKLGFSPINTTPSAQQVNLTVFEESTDENGVYTYESLLSPEFGQFFIPIASSWLGEIEYNVSFIGSFQYNTYSSTKFNASSSKPILWNSNLDVNQFPNGGNIHNRSIRSSKPSYWIYNSTKNQTVQYSESLISQNSNYIEILNASNHKWNIYYNQTNVIGSTSLRVSSNKQIWKTASQFINITDYINISSSLTITNGIGKVWVESTKKELEMQTEITETTMNFPLWRVDLNTSVSTNNTDFSILVGITNGTVAGIDCLSFRTILSQLNTSLSDYDKEVIKGEDVFYDFSVTNEFNNENITITEFLIRTKGSSEAWESLIENYHFAIDIYEEGKYNITLDTTRPYFIAGSYEINITFSAKYFADYTFNNTFTILERAHQITLKGASKESRLFALGEEAIYSIYLNDSITGEGIVDAEIDLWANFSISNGERQQIQSLVYEVEDYDDGNYNITLRTDFLFNDKDYLNNLTIEFYSRIVGIYSVSNANDTLLIHNPAHKTIVNILANTSVEVNFGDNVWVYLQFRDITAGENLTNGAFFLSNGSDSIVSNAYSIARSPNGYNFSFNLYFLEPGTYKIKIDASNPNMRNMTYLSASVIFNFTLFLYPSEITVPEDYNNQICYQEQTFEVVAILKDTFRQIDILDANVRMRLQSSSDHSVSFTPIASKFGWYLGTYETGSLSPGDYQLVIEMTADDYLDVSQTVNLKILEKKKPKLTLLSNLNPNYVWGDLIVFEVELIDGNSPIHGETIRIEIVETDEEGKTTIEDYLATTNSKGIARIDYIVPEIDNIEFQIFYEGSVSLSSGKLDQAQIDIRSTSEQLFLGILPFIPLMIGAAIALVGYQLSRRKQKQKQRLHWKTKQRDYKDIMNIKHMLIMHKLSGRVILQDDYADTEFDGTLVSGFLQAITAFIYGLQKQKIDGQEKSIFLFDHQAYKILLLDGELIRAALILEKEPTLSLKQGFNDFITQFEDEYRDKITNFDGMLKPFKGYIKLSNNNFRLTLFKEHRIAKKIPKVELTEFESKLLQITQTYELISNKQFNIPELRDYLIKTVSDHSEEEITAGVIGLVEKNVLMPVL